MGVSVADRLRGLQRHPPRTDSPGAVGEKITLTVFSMRHAEIPAQGGLFVPIMLDIRLQQRASNDLTEVFLVVESSAIRLGRVAVPRRRARVCCALLAALAIACGDLEAAEVPSNGREPARLRPIETVSYEIEVTEQPPAPLPYSVGYDNGFVIANHGDAGIPAGEFPFLMRVNSWLQLRHTLFAANDGNPDLNLFSFERLRLTFGGHTYSPDLKYFLQLDGNSDQSSDAVFLDYFISYDLGHANLGCEEGRLGIKAGKWKVPFSRSREESGRRFQFTERTTSNLFFDLNRSIGVGLFGELEILASPIRWETALFNGFQTGGDTNVRDAGLDQHLAWSTRLAADFFGEFGGDGEPDLSWHEVPALRLGCGFALTRIDAQGINEFNSQRVVDSGVTLASLLAPLPSAVTAYDVGMYTVDAHWKYRGLSVIAEYYWRGIANFRGADVPSLFDHGFNLQFGQFVVPERLELLARWSRIVGDSGTLGLTDQSTDEVGIGFAWYFRGHQAKIVFDATRMNGMPLSSPRLDLLPGSDGWLMRTQLQLAF
jgi:hypothetical protein